MSEDGYVARVEVGSRLHFGFLDLSVSGERIYGSLGVGIDKPQLTIRSAPHNDVEVEAPPEVLETAESYARTSVEQFGVEGVSLSVDEMIPRHVGLGSGTRLALGVAAAVSRSYELEPDFRDIAPELGRARRSGVGVSTFLDGGFVVDAGHPAETFSTPEERGVPETVLTTELRPDWKWVVAVPGYSESPSGEREEILMNQVVDGEGDGISDKVSEILSRNVLPGVNSGKIELFGSGIQEIDRINGERFEDQQDGVYAEPELVDLGRSLDEVYAAGQSSWGPSVYMLTRKETVDTVVEYIEENGSVDADIQVCSTDESGYRSALI
ncbi:MAG: beta-ribofuranosylaminobenzene 5'-phosphate synthase family protein [Halobacteria archaeon]